MASSIDPSRTPTAPVIRVLAEAALQRQNMLLRPNDAGRAASAGPVDLPFPAPQPGAGALPLPSPLPLPLPLPAQADRVSLSAQARGSLLNAGEPALGTARTTAGAGGSNGRPAQTPAGGTARTTAGVAAEATAAVRPTAWPAGGVAAPLRQVLDALVRQLTAPGQAQRVVAAQPWSAALEQRLTDDPAGVPPLRTWLVGQGTVQTPEGARNLSLALRVPAAWMQEQPAAATTGQASTATATGTLAAAFAGRPQALASGLFALVLQPQEPDGARTSALLSIDFAPWLAAQAATVYGRDPRIADPWLQMAALQASGWRPPADDEAQDGQGTPCDTPGCPYAGRAACVQPFCMALRVVPAGAAQAADNGPHPPT
ncbi:MULTISPECIES: hypothetical protein [unclassified Acidovorax]|uniref:hypothetical protein n=1 Tax=unclassified Acidovorax TaxID=2684926 RepID=UPI002882DFD4|nr:MULTISPECIES: hypothetical protein [unclassified Acidovorax]